MMRIVPYLNFDGDCKQAFEFYHQVFGGEEPRMFTFADVPMEGLPDELKDRIMHTQLEFHGQTIMGSDVQPGMYQPPASISVSVQLDDATEAKRLFDRLSESGTVTMPWDKQEWGALFGMATDKFGIPWMINCEQAPQ